MRVLGKSMIRDDIPSTSNYVFARRSFLLGAFLMVVTMPFIHYKLPVSVEASIVLAVIVTIVAGLTQVKQKIVSLLDVIISFVAFTFYARYIIVLILDRILWSWFFWINISLEIIFFFAFYFSVSAAVELYFKKENTK